MRTTNLVLIVSFALVACGGSRLESASAAHHDEEAAKEESAAKEHLARFRPNARKETQHCGGGAALRNESDPPCWTEVTNPTEHNLSDAEAHRKHAAEHRAASFALREAEAKACQGVAPADRDESPFHHREDVTRTMILTPPVGAVFAFEKVEGLTVAKLQRIVDCHIARDNALGNVVPDMAYCPLVPKGATAQVSDGGAVIIVKIWSDDPEGAKEIVARAKAFPAAK